MLKCDTNSVVVLKMVFLFLQLGKFYSFFCLSMETKHFNAKDVPTTFTHKPGSSNTFWIILISVLFFLFLVFSKWDKIEEFFGFSLESTALNSGFLLGEEVSVEGILTQDGDFITHTHKLSTLTSGVFWLKSKTINLNQYSWTVLVEWLIDTQHQELFIIDVIKITAQIDSGMLMSWETETGTIVGQYFPEIWLYFSPSFFDEYEIISTDKNILQIKSLTSNSTIKIDYFLCKRGDANRDCKQLSSTFTDSSEKSFTNQYGTTFYKLAEVSSWFFANQDLFGYFINNVPEQEVTKISSYITLPTSEYIKTMIQPKVSTLCKAGNIIMNEVKKTTLFIDQGKPAVTFAGIWEKWSAECTIILDLSLSSFWTVKSFNYKEDGLTWANSTTSLDVPVVSQPKPSQIDTNVTQFPISLEKPLVFTSSRGHSISFPSSKISYSSTSVSENLDTAWVNCYVATNVIEYAKKDLIDSEPTVIVYECKIKENVDLPYQYYLKPVSDGRTFVVSVLNPAWNDFANNIQVTLNQ